MVSFIVIGKNEGWRLKKCFEGLYAFIEAECITKYEVIYVDSKSTDGSIELSKKFGNTKTLLITGECNAAIARNIGAKEARGNILFFIDGDMELLPGFWFSIVRNDSLIYPFVSGIENDVLYDKEWNYIRTKVRRNFKEGIDKYEVTTGGMFIIDAGLWEKTGGMDNRLKRSQDLDLGFRLTKMGYRLCRKPQIWVNHYTRDYVVRTDYCSFFRYSAMLLRKHFFNIDAQIFLAGPNYTLWALVISLILLMLLRSWLPVFLYLFAIGIRTLRTYLRNKHNVNVIKTYYKLIGFDILFVYYFITFWPHQVSLDYDIK